MAACRRLPAVFAGPIPNSFRVVQRDGGILFQLYAFPNVLVSQKSEEVL